MARRGALLAAQREGVLLLARDPVLLGQRLRGLAHELLGQRAQEAVLVHGVHGRLVAHPVAPARARSAGRARGSSTRCRRPAPRRRRRRARRGRPGRWPSGRCRRPCSRCRRALPAGTPGAVRDLAGHVGPAAGLARAAEDRPRRPARARCPRARQRLARPRPRRAGRRSGADSAPPNLPMGVRTAPATTTSRIGDSSCRPVRAGARAAEGRNRERQAENGRIITHAAPSRQCALRPCGCARRRPGPRPGRGPRCRRSRRPRGGRCCPRARRARPRDVGVGAHERQHRALHHDHDLRRVAADRGQDAVAGRASETLVVRLPKRSTCDDRRLPTRRRRPRRTGGPGQAAAGRRTRGPDLLERHAAARWPATGPNTSRPWNVGETCGRNRPALVMAWTRAPSWSASTG